MHIIQLKDVSLDHPGRELFHNLSWAIDDSDRVGLVGHNGAGKSSLLKLLTGESVPTSGIITRMRGATVGYLPQSVDLPPNRTLWDESTVLPPRLAEAEAKLSAIEAQLSDPDVYNNAARLERTLADQDVALQAWSALGGEKHAGKIREILAMLGFSATDYDLPTEGLSGGQKKLVALTRLIAEQPALLLLDEPDNHLDLAAKRRLEKVLKNYRGAFIIVSHDRYLLDEVVNQIAEVENKTLVIYRGNYSQFATQRELNRLRNDQLYVAQQKRIAQIEAAIHEWQMKARADLGERHARQARSRQKFLDKLEANGEIIEKTQERKQIALNLAGSRGSTKALEIRKLTMGFEDDLLFYNLDLLVQHGERVGLIGGNGTGKSVLLKLILGDYTPLEGDIRIGASNRVGYYAQEHQTLDTWGNRTPLEFIRDVSPSAEGAAVHLLLKLLFTYEQTRQPIHSLSGGERSRLQLAALMLQKPNLLLLDEPTNNLDIPSSEALENALDDFQGAALIISHDRYFLDRVVDRVVILKDGALKTYPGGYTEYLESSGG